MGLYSHAKNQKKLSKPFWENPFSRIEPSDWPRAFRAITHQPEFSRTCGFHRKVHYHKIFHLNIIWIPSPWLDFPQNWKKCQKWHFLTLFAGFREKQIFFRKSGFVSFLTLSIVNLMQKIRKNYWSVLCNFWTDQPTDKLFFWLRTVSWGLYLYTFIN